MGVNGQGKNYLVVSNQGGVIDSNISINFKVVIAPTIPLLAYVLGLKEVTINKSISLRYFAWNTLIYNLSLLVWCNWLNYKINYK